MSGRRNIIAQILAALFATLAMVSAAQARCTINAAGLSVSPTTASTGTYTPPTAPSSVAVTFTVIGTYNTNGSAGTCTVAIAFNRASLPATMARSGGGATLSYSIRSAASGGGNSILITGAAVPTATQRVQVSFTSAGPNLTNRAFTTSLTAHFLMAPASPQRAGSYSDGPTLRVYNVSTAGTAALRLTQAFTVTGTVNMACTIGGVATPAADSATIPVSPAGVVTTTPIAKSYLTVVCNSTTNVLATSLGGAVKIGVSPPSGFTNMINYSAAATFSGATSNLNTATIPTATGAEAGTTVATASTTPTGTLSVTITPQSVASSLIGGSYSDTLRITLAPF